MKILIQRCNSSENNFADDEAALGRLEAAISLDPDEESPMDLIQVYEDIGDIYFKLERNGDFEPFPNNPPAHSTTQKDKPVYSCSTGKNLKEQFGLIHSVLTAEKVQIQSDDDLARSTQSMSSEDEGEDESSRNDGRLGSSTEMYLKGQSTIELKLIIACCSYIR